jgi:hypothetical protein
MHTVVESRGGIGTVRAKARARALAEEQLRAEYAGRRESPDFARLIGFAMLLMAAALIVIGSVGT